MVHLLALLLLSTDVPVPPGLDLLPGMVAALREIAVREEWIYASEWNVWSADRSRCAGDLLLALRERRDGCRGLPRVADLRVLPEGAYLAQQEAFASAHIVEIAARRAICWPYERTRYDEWLTEAKTLREVYDTLRDLREQQPGEGRNIIADREALAWVASIIGRDNLECGNLPPCVPLWRFRRVP